MPSSQISPGLSVQDEGATEGGYQDTLGSQSSSWIPRFAPYSPSS